MIPQIINIVTDLISVKHIFIGPKIEEENNFVKKHFNGIILFSIFINILLYGLGGFFNVLQWPQIILILILIFQYFYFSFKKRFNYSKFYRITMIIIYNTLLIYGGFYNSIIQKIKL